MKRIARLPVDNASDALAGYDQLQRILRRHLPPSTVNLYAQPKQAQDGMVEWYSDLGGQPVPLAELDEKEAANVRRLLDERLASVEQAAANVPTADESVRQVLRQAARYPKDEHIYVLNGQPVITAWGAPPPPPPPPPPPEVLAPPPIAVTPVIPAKRSGGWLWLLLALLLLALLGGLLWWWFNRDKTAPLPELPPAVEAVLPVEEEEETIEPVEEEEEEEEEEALVEDLPEEPVVEEIVPEEEEAIEPVETVAEPVIEKPAVEPKVVEPSPPPPVIEKPAVEPPKAVEPPPPPPDPLAQGQQRLDQAGNDCRALERLRNDRQFRNNAALQQQLQQRLMQRCREQMISKAREMCPEERPAELAPEMVIVFDASGSMDISLLATQEEVRRASSVQGMAHILSQALLGKNAPVPVPDTMARVYREPKRITAARQATSTVVEQLPSDVNAGLVLVESCPAARSVGFFPPGKRRELLGRISNITPVEGTPLADGIAKAGALLDGVNRESVMLVVSDGEESCGQDPCAVARQLASRKPHLRINVVDILGSGAGNCLAQATGGKVYTANNVQELQSMTTRAAQDVLLPAHCRK